MFARLLLAVLLAAFALPALANGPCHDSPMTAMAATMPAQSTPAPHHGDAIPTAHVCIGCIPPASLATHAATAPLPVAALPRHDAAVTFDPASGTPPALPPPRRTA